MGRGDVVAHLRRRLGSRACQGDGDDIDDAAQGGTPDGTRQRGERKLGHPFPKPVGNIDHGRPSRRQRQVSGNARGIRLR